MVGTFPTLLVSRRPRQAGVNWFGARSWLGGAPRLGATAWPCDASGEPLHFVAQIDLAEIADAAGGTPMPADGSLAFFIGREGAVIFVPKGQGTTPVDPPAGTPDLTKFGAASDWAQDLEGRPLYPYWPVCFSVLDLPPPPEADDDDYDDRCEAFDAAQTAAVERHFKRRQYNLAPEQAFAGPPIPDWWQIAIHYANHLAKAVRDIPGLLEREQASLDRARKRVEEAQAGEPKELKKATDYVALCERKIAALHQTRPTFVEFAAAVCALSTGRDPWTSMNAAEIAQLASLWSRNSEFAAFHFNHGKFALDYLKEEMFKALPARGTPEFAALPPSVRTLIEQKRAPRPQWWLMAIHYAERLREAERLGLPGATKRHADNIAAYRKRLNALQPKGLWAAFRRMLSAKSPDVIKLEADIARAEAEIAKLRRLEVPFKQFVAATIDRTRGRDPWSLMQPADVEHLDAQMKRARDEFRDFTYSYAPQRRESLEITTLVTMASADDRGYAALPEPVRTLINRDYLLPAGPWHQMFGRGVEIQGDSCAMREEGYIMLLQLSYDDLMHWSFGDNGVYQFWIAPDDLMRRNWSAAKMTFECH